MISLQKEEAKKEQVRLQSLLDFVEHSLAVQSDQQIVASKEDVLDRLNKAVSQKIHAKFDPLENAEIKYKKNMKALEQCKNLGFVDCSFLHEKCQLISHSTVAAGKEACCELGVQHKNGSPLSISTSLFSVQLTASKDPQPAGCTIKEMAPGKYAISYTPISRSPHQLRVMVGGEEIPGSAFTLPVLAPTLETIGQPLLVAVKGLKRPEGVAVGRKGQVIISEYFGHCIKIFSSDFKLVESVGSQGKGNGQFWLPSGLAIASDSSILVADTGNHRIQVLTADGQFLRSIGSYGSGPLQFRCPREIAVHPNGQILVCELFPHRVQVLNSNFTFSHFFENPGSQPDKCDSPCGMAVDSCGMVYIADYHNSRIQKFAISGKYQAQFVVKDPKDNHHCRPGGIAIDANDLVYVSEPHNNRISVFTSNGTFIKYLGSGYQDHPILHGPSGLTLDKSGNLYVCDYNSGQLVVF